VARPCRIYTGFLSRTCSRVGYASDEPSKARGCPKRVFFWERSGAPVPTVPSARHDIIVCISGVSATWHIARTNASRNIASGIVGWSTQRSQTCDGSNGMCMKTGIHPSTCRCRVMKSDVQRMIAKMIAGVIRGGGRNVGAIQYFRELQGVDSAKIAGWRVGENV